MVSDDVIVELNHVSAKILLTKRLLCENLNPYRNAFILKKACLIIQLSIYFMKCARHDFSGGARSRNLGGHLRGNTHFGGQDRTSRNLPSPRCQNF